MKALLAVLHRLFRRKANVDCAHQPHVDAIRSALPQRSQIQEYDDWAVDHISFLREDFSGDHVYLVQVNAIDGGTETLPLIWEAQTRMTGGAIAVVYWVAL